MAIETDSEENPVVTVNGAFSFGDAKPIESTVKDDEPIPSSNDDIPKVPEQKVSFFGGDSKATGSGEAPKSRNRNSDKHRARQREYRSRIEMARQTAPMVAAVLHGYLKSRGVEFPTNDPNFMVVKYWWIDTPKGEELVEGTIAEALSFHGLASTGGLSDRLVEFIESHTSIFGLLYIAGMMAYLEVIIQRALEAAAKEAKAKQDETPMG